MYYIVLCDTLIVVTTTSYTKWLAQIRKGYIELCVLVCLQKKSSSYGFELLQIFDQLGLEINEGTLYPLLNRMNKNGWLTSYWHTPSRGGHPRRFYQLSEEGAKLLPRMLESFQKNQETLDLLRKLT